MTRKNSKSLIVLLAVVAAVASPFVTWRLCEHNVQQAEKALQQQAAQVAQASATGRESAAAAPGTAATQPLSTEQVLELARLRNEVGGLREKVAEVDHLRAVNEQLLSGKSTVTATPPPLQPASPTYWPKDQLAFMGFATPESALQSTLWAMKNHDLNTMIQCIPQEAQTAFEVERAEDGRTNDPHAEFVEMADSLISGTTAFHIIDSHQKTPDVAIVTVSFEGEGTQSRFVLKRHDGSWKFNGGLLDGEPEP